MRVNLKVPFAEKDKARALGARWDVARKTWYIEDVEDLEPFLPWMAEHLKRPVAAAKGTPGAAERLTL